MSTEYSLEMFLEIKNDIKYLIDDPSNFKEFRKNDKKRLVSKFGKILEKSKLHTYEHLNFYFDELINLYLF